LWHANVVGRSEEGEAVGAIVVIETGEADSGEGVAITAVPLATIVDHVAGVPLAGRYALAHARRLEEVEGVAGVAVIALRGVAAPAHAPYVEWHPGIDSGIVERHAMGRRLSWTLTVLRATNAIPTVQVTDAKPRDLAAIEAADDAANGNAVSDVGCRHVRVEDAVLCKLNRSCAARIAYRAQGTGIAGGATAQISHACVDAIGRIRVDGLAIVVRRAGAPPGGGGTSEGRWTVGGRRAAAAAVGVAARESGAICSGEAVVAGSRHAGNARGDAALAVHTVAGVLAAHLTNPAVRIAEIPTTKLGDAGASVTAAVRVAAVVRVAHATVTPRIAEDTRDAASAETGRGGGGAVGVVDTAGLADGLSGIGVAITGKAGAGIAAAVELADIEVGIAKRAGVGGTDASIRGGADHAETVVVEASKAELAVGCGSRALRALHALCAKAVVRLLDVSHAVGHRVAAFGVLGALNAPARVVWVGVGETNEATSVDVDGRFRERASVIALVGRRTGASRGSSAGGSSGGGCGTRGTARRS
jgi:hypothetical protein